MMKNKGEARLRSEIRSYGASDILLRNLSDCIYGILAKDYPFTTLATHDLMY